MRARVQAIAVAVVVVLASCRQTIGIGDPEPPLACHAPAGGVAACGECLEKSCCVELFECGNDAACADLLACTGACSSDACRADCESKHRLTDAAAKVFACQVSRCEAACGLGCGGAGPPVSGCKACASACCAEGTAFRGSVEGQMLRVCRAGCAPGDVACRERCSNEHPAGADLELAGTECVVRACEVRGEWSCVGKTEKRKPASGPFLLSLVLQDQATGAPLAGVTAKGCNAVDLACASPPYGNVKTDALGHATLTIPVNGPMGVASYGGFVELSRFDYATFLVYFAPPLTQTQVVHVALPSNESLSQAELASGVTLAADRGSLIAGATDCGKIGRGAVRAAGVSIHADTADAASRTFYFKGSVTAGLTLDFAATSTSEAGFGGITNLPVGLTRVSTVVEGLCLTTGTTTVGIRAGAVSLVFIDPLP